MSAAYEEIILPRLWMIDLCYDNVEVDHASEYGLALKASWPGAICSANRFCRDWP